MDKKNSQLPTQLFVGVGTTSCEDLDVVREEIAKTTDETHNTVFLAVDTSSKVESLQEKGFETFLLGNGQGSGMSPAAAHEAFMSSQERFLKLLREIAPPEQLLCASVFSAPGRGGTSAGTSIPLWRTLKHYSEAPVLNYHIQPPVIKLHPGHKQTDPRQFTYSTKVREQLVKQGVKSFVVDTTWVVNQEFGDKKISLTDARKALNKHLAKAMASMSLFWNSKPWDPNDLRRILHGDGFLKHAEFDVDLAKDADKELERVFAAIKNHNLYVFEGEIYAVAPVLYGAWEPRHFQALQQQIARLVGKSNESSHLGHFQKENELPIKKGEKSRLAILLASAPIEHRPEEEEFPDFSEAEYVAGADFPPDGNAEGKVKPVLVKGFNKQLTRAYQDFRSLLNEALAGGKPEAVMILRQGDPYSLKDHKIQDSRRKLTDLLWFTIGGPELGESLLGYMSTPDDGDPSKGNCNCIRLERVEIFHERHGLSPQWKALIFDTVTQALAKNNWQLPRYIANPVIGTRKAVPSVIPDTLRKMFEWKEAWGKDSYKKRPPLAQLALVRVTMERIFDPQSPEFLELLEPEDTRTFWRHLLDHSRATIVSRLPKPVRKLVGKPKRQSPTSFIPLVLEPQPTPPALGELNVNLLAEPASPGNEMVVAHGAANIAQSTTSIQ